MASARRPEQHLVSRVGWLRAAVLGANDGTVSTASLVVGVAGALSVAAGEYVSVSSQAGTERAEVARETRELAEQPAAELEELIQIYVTRGVELPLARRIAEQMTAHDALALHTRDELGLSEHVMARPIQAAWTSALTFTVGA